MQLGVYATSNAQRASILELEERLFAAIAAHPDTAWQRSVRATAADTAYPAAAASIRRDFEVLAAKAPLPGLRSTLATNLAEGYGGTLKNVVRATAADSAPSCLATALAAVHASALAAMEEVGASRSLKTAYGMRDARTGSPVLTL